MTRYPFSALLDAVRGGRPWHRDSGCPFCCQSSGSSGCVKVRDVYELLRLSGQQRAVYFARGLDEVQADRCAVRAGFHPWEVWPEMVEHRLAEMGGVAA